MIEPINTKRYITEKDATALCEVCESVNLIPCDHIPKYFRPTTNYHAIMEEKVNEIISYLNSKDDQSRS